MPQDRPLLLTPGRRLRAKLLPALAALVACAASPLAAAEPPHPQFMILGFDGVDPVWLKGWMDEGKLPNLARLAREGAFLPLTSTNPPQSPVAWSSFATGTNPGGHGIYDFVTRDPKTYLPDISSVRIEKPTYRWGILEKDPPRAMTNRGGTAFWKVAADRGIQSTVLLVPFAFPPDELGEGEMLSGLGVPDLRGTNSTFTYFATNLTAQDMEKPVGGAKFVPVHLQGDVGGGELEGPVDPTIADFQRLTIPVEFRVDRAARRVTISCQGGEATLGAGEWSDWFQIEFRVSFLSKISGICRFAALEVTPNLRIYCSPLNYHPARPYVPFTWPPSFSRDIVRKVGLYKTVGWDHDTSALNSEKVDEEFFLKDLFATMGKQEEILLAELRDHPGDLFIAAFTATDRVAHMFYRLLDPAHPRYDAALAERYGDAMLRVYQRMDAIVGRVREKLDPRTVLLIMSDHGFHSFRYGLNVNTWLVRNGFLALKGVAAGREVPAQFFSDRDFFPGVDWGRTKAYALGTGQVYINVRGREGQGTVAPGAEYESVCEAIARGLEGVIDPGTGEPVVEEVYRAREVYRGPYANVAPDLQIAFREGYCTSWETRLGAFPPELLAPNRQKWSGEHAASDIRDTPGVLLANRRIARVQPSIVDIGPTVLRFFRIPPPREMEGRDLLTQEGS